MGKYIRKSKSPGQVALMDLTHSPLGVTTRAKTLARQNFSPDGGAAYLQLRSRRLFKSPFFVNNAARKHKLSTKPTCVQNPNPNFQTSNSRSGSRLRVCQGNSDSGSIAKGKSESGAENVARGETEVEGKKIDDDFQEIDADLGLEASFGENVLGIEGRERTTRESTPSSFIRGPDMIRNLGSSTPETIHIPETNEMNSFFTAAEKEQQRKFMDKYNFDPVNDKPLPGRYIWEKVEDQNLRKS